MEIEFLGRLETLVFQGPKLVAYYIWETAPCHVEACLRQGIVFLRQERRVEMVSDKMKKLWNGADVVFSLHAKNMTSPPVFVRRKVYMKKGSLCFNYKGRIIQLPDTVRGVGLILNEH